MSVISATNQESTVLGSSISSMAYGSIYPGQFGYYLAISLILLCAWFFRSSRKTEVSAPLYKASRRKWMFEADSLIRDSYFKVSSL